MPSPSHDSESFEGFWDGRHYGSDRFSARVRRELQRYELALDDSHAVCVLEPPASPVADPTPPAFDDASEAYRSGWETGVQHGHEETLLKIRTSLVRWDLYLTETGTLAPTSVVDELLQAMETWRGEHQPRVPDDADLHSGIDEFLREQLATGHPPKAPSPTPPTCLDMADIYKIAAEITEESGSKPFHIPEAIIDLAKVPAENDGDPLPSPAEDERHGTGARGSLLSWLIAMVSKRISRRAAITTLCTAVVAGGLGIGARYWNPGEAKPEVTRTQGGGYVAPNHWDHMPPSIRTYYLGLDQIVWNLEQSPSGVGDVSAGLSQVMATPNSDELKGAAIYFITSSARATYAESLLFALIPGTSSATIRGHSVRAVNRLVAGQGSSVLSLQMQSAIQWYEASGLETDAQVLTELSILLSQLGL